MGIVDYLLHLYIKRCVLQYPIQFLIYISVQISGYNLFIYFILFKELLRSEIEKEEIEGRKREKKEERRRSERGAKGSSH